MSLGISAIAESERKGAGGALAGQSGRPGNVPISSEYHRRQAATLTQFAQDTRDAATAKALLRMAYEHFAQRKWPSRHKTRIPSIHYRLNRPSSVLF